MNYKKLKNILKKIIPTHLFNLLIQIWRKTAVRINEIYNRKYQKKILKGFDKEYFKLIKIYDHSFFLKLNPMNGYVDDQFYLHGIYEKEIYDIIFKYMKEGDVFVDIGANIGMYTNFVPKIVGSKGRVIGFEPIKRIYTQNLQSIKKNNYANVTLYNKACGDINKSMFIHLLEGNIGGSSIIANKNTTQKETIDIIRGDSVLQNEPKIDFIKIDTEGYELAVLYGIEKTISTYRPKLIIEFSPYLFESQDIGIKILHFISSYYNTIELISTGLILDLMQPADQKLFYDLIYEDQENLFCY